MSKRDILTRARDLKAELYSRKADLIPSHTAFADMLRLFKRHPSYAEKTGNDEVVAFYIRRNNIGARELEWCYRTHGGKEGNFAIAKCFDKYDADELARPELTYQDLTIVVDTREQKPLGFDARIVTTRGILGTGDYTALGYESQIAIERKSIEDLASSFCAGRARFTKCLKRLEKFALRAVVVEGSELDIGKKQYHADILPADLLGYVNDWRSRMVPFYFADNREGASKLVTDLIFNYARRNETSQRDKVGA